MLVRVVKMTFKENEVENFKLLFESRKERIRNFPGCYYLELWQDRLHPTTFFTYSHWIDAAALDNYRHSEFFNKTWSKTKQLFAGKPEAWSVNPVVVLP